MLKRGLVLSLVTVFLLSAFPAAGARLSWLDRVPMLGRAPVLRDRVRADDPNRAALVIQYSDEHLDTRCLDLDDGQTTGADLLLFSGLEVVMDTVSSMGVTVCQIQEVGCTYPTEPCFCQCMGGSGCVYWNYYYRDPGSQEWTYSPLGALSRKVHPGSAEAWVWGDGRTPPDESLTYDAICLPSAPTPGGVSSATADATVILPVETLSPTPAPVLTRPLAVTPSPIQSATAATVPIPTPMPSAPGEPGLPSTASEAVASYWPFGLAVAGLFLVGLFVRLRRTDPGR